MKFQRGFMFVEPLLLLAVLVDLKLTDMVLGTLMIGLSLLALVCQIRRSDSVI